MGNHGDFDCCYYKNYSTPTKYQVTFTTGNHGRVRVSIIVAAESIGAAVLEAIKLLSNDGFDMSKLSYGNCAQTF